jgi:hypothetical protein
VAAARNDYGFQHGIDKFISNVKYLLKFQPAVKRNSKSKLVLIISFPRSGTHALASMIKHDQIAMHYYGEFFIFNQWSPMVEKLNKYIPFFSWRYFLNTKRQKREWTHFRFEKTTLDPIKTIEKMLAFPGTHIIKIFPEHLKLETLQKLIVSFNPHILILRRNHLDRYVSLIKANKSGLWHAVDSSNFQIEIDDLELNKYISKYEDWYSAVKKSASANSCQIMDIEFKQLQDPNITTQVQKFVSLDGRGLDSLPKTPTTTKMDKSSKIQDDYLAVHNKKLSDFDFMSIQ